MAGEYDDIGDDDMDSIISALESGDNISSEDTNDSDNDDADLEDTKDTDDSGVDTDTKDEADDADSDTDDETDDDVDTEDAQAEEDDADEDTADEDEDTDTEDEDDSTDDGTEEDSEDDTDGVDEDLEEDDAEDDGSADGDDEDDIEDEEGEAGDGEEPEVDEFFRQAQDVEFMVNGKKVKGLGTIEDMVKARQMAGGLNEKFKAIKELRPFLAPLKDRGLIDNPEKFNLAMQIIDGDKDALKKFMIDGGIDPLDMDMDVVNYEAKSSLASNEEIMYNDTLDVARQFGVDDKFNKVVLNEWDSASLAQFFATPESAASIGTALAAQMENGLYDEVMGEVANLESKDVHGTFGAKSSIDKYNEASNIVNARNATKETVTKAADDKKTEDQVDVKKVEAAKKKIEEKRKKEAYTKKLEEKNKQADDKRKKASAASKVKTKVAPAKKADPYSLEGEDLDSFVDELMTSFR